ncbi:MAG: hypothetical protein MI864_15335 [Pseudomonadales bacterium]|nr:hypothetical protein [Pseudomonadales bacterium]
MRRYLTGILLVLQFVSSCALAGPGEQAKRIYDRITGVTADAEQLQAMANLIEQGQAIDSAYIAMNEPTFYDVTLKDLATPWTNEAQTRFAPLNDYSATFIGLVRDELDIRLLLSADIIYLGNSSALPPYSLSDNNHYEQLAESGQPLKDSLVQRRQSEVNGLPAEATSGVLTTRAAAKAFFIGGTNRAMFRFTLMNHLCTDLEPLKDTSLPPDRIRQDVSRSPGGDSRIFLNNCIACHNAMDPMTQAFAYYEYEYDSDADPEGQNGQLTYNQAGTVDPETNSRVEPKNLINATNFPHGFVTNDDRWDNYWRSGKNRALGWQENLPGYGNGAKSFGEELANSEAFARCQVQKVFQNICLRAPENEADKLQVIRMTESLKANNFNLKQVFAESAVYCMGD